MIKHHLFKKTWSAWILLIVGLLVSAFASIQVKQNAEQDAVSQFNFVCNQVTLKVEERLNAYALILRGGSALFAASNHVSREEWRTYVKTLRAQTSFPGLQGIGFNQLVSADQLDRHVAQIQREGFSGYSVSPAGKRDFYTPIIYIEPFTDRNLRAFGFDTFSEPIRRSAMERARDTGEAALSGKVELKQENDSEVQAGALMYVPVYRNDMPKDTVAQRQSAIIGWISSPYRMTDLMQGILQDWTENEGKGVELHIFDGAQTLPESMLFGTQLAENSPLKTQLPSLLNQQRIVDFNGHQWLLVFDYPSTSSIISYANAWTTLLCGILLSGLLFSLLISMINTRSNAVRIADGLTEDIKRREADLKESEFRWKFAIEGSGDGLWDWNLADNKVFFSRAWKEMLGHAETEIGNDLDEWKKRVHPDDAVDAFAKMQDYLDGKTPLYISEHRVLCKDGSYKWMLGRGVEVSRDENVDGKPTRIIGTHANITLRKELVNAREDAFSRLYKIASQLPGVVYQYRLYPDGRACFPFASEGLQDIFHVSPEEVIEDASQILAIVHPDDYNDIVVSIQQSAQDLTPWRHEYRVKFNDGNVRWLFGNALPQREADGSTLWHGFTTDITERKDADAIFHGLFEQSSFLAGILDEQGRIVDVNSIALNFIDASREDIIGQYFPDTPWWSNPQDRAQLIEVLHLASAGKQAGFEATHPVYDGGEIHVMFSATPIFLDNGIYVSVIGVDITERKKSEQKLRISDLAMKSISQGVLIISADGLIVSVNDAFESISGYLKGEVLGKDCSFLQGPLTDQAAIANTSLAMKSLTEFAGELLHYRKDGTTFWNELSIMPVHDKQGSVQYFISIMRDITERKLAENDLRIAATAFETQEGILVTDANSVIIRINSAFTHITGYTPQEVIGQNPRILSSGRHSKVFYEAMWLSINIKGGWSGEVWNKRKSGDVYPEHLTITTVKDSVGRVTNYIATITDITMSNAAAEEIQHLAFYDPLTQLPNRRFLVDRIKQALSASERGGWEGALLFLDLDHFKTLNDTLGHDVGDSLLQQVAKRLSGCVRDGDTVARLGGDEFVVLLVGLSANALEAAAQTKAVGDKILLALNAPYQLGLHEHFSTPSIGATLFNKHQSSIEELLKQADIAMYQAKIAGRNTLCFFDQQMQDAISLRASLESDLRKALERQQFQLFYQAQVEITGRVLGAEALIRWMHPERGLVSPLNFIALAEETGLILPIGQWVLETACAQLKAWEASLLTSHLTLSINVSAKQFRQVDFVQQVIAAVQQYAINPELLKLELTESYLLENIEETVATMSNLKQVGIRFSLDDFGTGYSSLQYLKRLPLYQLKIDQSFVRDIAIDSSDQAIVQTIIAMAHTLNLNVIAEGVETEVQQGLLLNNGCMHYQGYLFGKPMPIEEFEIALKQISMF